MTLYDTLTRENVTDVESVEDAARIVGAIMSYFGKRFTQDRYVVYGNVDRRGAAPIVCGTEELHKRGTFYYRKR